MKKLDITINGLRYVPQCEHGSEFTTEELLSRISSLVIKLEQKDIIIAQKDFAINSLNERIDELEEDNAELFNNNMRLDEALTDIYQISKEFN